MTPLRVQLMQEFDRLGYDVHVSRTINGVEVHAHLRQIYMDGSVTVVRCNDGRGDADEDAALAAMAELLGVEMKTPAARRV